MYVYMVPLGLLLLLGIETNRSEEKSTIIGYSIYMKGTHTIIRTIGFLQQVRRFCYEGNE